MTMTEFDLKRIITKIQLGDNRQIDRLTALEWNDNIGDLDPDDCIAAITMHRRESTDYLQPAHIRTNVKRIRNERAMTSNEVDAAPRHSCPKPNNADALTAAASNPAEFRNQVAIYNRQLIDAGHTSCILPEYPAAPAATAA